MKMFNKVRTYMSGKKAFLAGTLMVALGAVQGDMELVLQGVSVIALRAGIEKRS